MCVCGGGGGGRRAGIVLLLGLNSKMYPPLSLSFWPGRGICLIVPLVPPVATCTTEAERCISSSLLA